MSIKTHPTVRRTLHRAAAPHTAHTGGTCLSSSAAGLHRPPGRPKQMKDEDRRQALIAAAEDVFAAKGFHAATMDDVAQRARMSKKTIYEQFDSKIDLFNAILDQRKDRLSLEASSWEGIEPGTERLVRCLMTIAERALFPKDMAILRVVIGESKQSPDLSDLFSRTMIDPGPFGVRECLQRLQGEGGPRFDDLQEATDLLTGMALGAVLLKSLVNETYRLTQPELEKRIRRAVDVFLSGCCSGV